MRLARETLQSPELKYGTVCRLTYDYICSHCRRLGRDLTLNAICLSTMSAPEDVNVKQQRIIYNISS